MPNALILLFLFCSCAVSKAWAVDPLALPINPVVIGGQASVHTLAPGQMEVQQATQRSVIQWNKFDVGSNAQVRFVQPNAQAIAVNRVNGQDAQPTQIMGRLRGNGRIVVLDANGVMFGPDSRVDASSLLASTGDIDTASFIMDTQDRIQLTQAGDIGARVENQGRITIAQSGLAALVAPHVANSGIITANLGKVVLAGAETATLDLYGDGLFSLAVPQATQAVSVTQAGTITANSGVVEMTTQDTQAALSNVINLGGLTQTQNINSRNGVIRIRTGKNGNVHVTGRAVATGDVAIHADRDVRVTKLTGAGQPSVTTNRQGRLTLTAQNGALITGGLQDVFSNGNGGDIYVTAGGGGSLQNMFDAVQNDGIGQTHFILGSALFLGDAVLATNNVTLRGLDPAAPATITGQSFGLRISGDQVTMRDIRVESLVDGLLIGRLDQAPILTHFENVSLSAGRIGLFAGNAMLDGLGTVDIQGGTQGLVLDGAFARVAGDTLQGLRLSGQAQEYIRLQNGAMAGQSLDARGTVFGMATKQAGHLTPANGLSDTAYWYLADRIFDGADTPYLGTVFLGRSAPVIATPIDYTKVVDINRYTRAGIVPPVFSVTSGSAKQEIPFLAAALNALAPANGNEDEDGMELSASQSSF